MRERERDRDEKLVPVTLLHLPRSQVFFFSKWFSERKNTPRPKSSTSSGNRKTALKDMRYNIYNTVWSQQILVQGFMTIKTKISNGNNLQQFKYVVWKSDFSSFLLDMWIHWNICAVMLLHLRNTHWLSHCTNQLRSVYLQSHCKEYQKTRNN